MGSDQVKLLNLWKNTGKRREYLALIGPFYP